jgi:prostaglandin-E synthase 1
MTSPLFVAYAVTALVLSLNLMVLWAMSGGVRTRTKTAVNPEDAAQFKVAQVDADPPAVARVLRAHANAEASIYPFLILGLVYVLAGGGCRTGAIIFAVFVIARILHSVFYVAARQPWRTISFVVGALATLALMIALVIRLIALGGH